MSKDFTQRPSYKLLGILQEYAPDAATQARCTNMYNNAAKLGHSERELAWLFAAAISEGLQNNLWPWSKETDEEIDRMIFDNTGGVS